MLLSLCQPAQRPCVGQTYQTPLSYPTLEPHPANACGSNAVREPRLRRPPSSACGLGFPVVQCGKAAPGGFLKEGRWGWKSTRMASTLPNMPPRNWRRTPSPRCSSSLAMSSPPHDCATGRGTSEQRRGVADPHYYSAYSHGNERQTARNVPRRSPAGSARVQRAHGRPGSSPSVEVGGLSRGRSASARAAGRRWCGIRRIPPVPAISPPSPERVSGAISFARMPDAAGRRGGTGDSQWRWHPCRCVWVLTNQRREARGGGLIRPLSRLGKASGKSRAASAKAIPPTSP